MRKLYRSRKNKILFGVCGGLANYLGVDPTLIRILFVAFAILKGYGIIIYLLLAILMPEEPEEQ
jgi:phage shock protein C